MRGNTSLCSRYCGRGRFQISRRCSQWIMMLKQIKVLINQTFNRRGSGSRKIIEVKRNSPMRYNIRSPRDSTIQTSRESMKYPEERTCGRMQTMLMPMSKFINNFSYSTKIKADEAYFLSRKTTKTLCTNFRDRHSLFDA